MSDSNAIHVSTQCSEHNKTCTQEIESFLDDPVRVTNYDGVSLELDESLYPNVFGVNIDTILFCKAMKQLLARGMSYASFLEVGIGSGFIAKYLKHKLPNSKATLLDIERDCVKYATTNLGIADSFRETEVGTYLSGSGDVKVILGDALKFLPKLTRSNGYNLFVCNPPYIPKYNEEKLKDDISEYATNFFEGTFLMRYLIRNVSRLCSEDLVMIISSTSFCVDEVVRELGEQTFEVLSRDRVPLKVYTTDEKGTRMFLHEDEQWMRFLRQRTREITVRGVPFHAGVYRSGRDDFPLSHDVYVVRIRSKTV